MEGLGSIWCYQDILHSNQESIDELRGKLQDTLFEVEVTKMEADELATKHIEETKHLLNLLEIAYHERDEARDHLTLLLKTLKQQPSCPSENPFPLIPTKANSSITASNSFSQSYASPSPVDSPLEFSSHHHIGFVNQQQWLIQEFGVPTAQTDPSDAVIDDLVKGKILPQRGYFLQAVMEAGPLLQTQLEAGPLPQWRNPPPPQHFGIPPVSIRGFDATSNSSSNNEISRGSNHQTCSDSMLRLVSSSSVMGINTQILASKRQRLH